jgi:hypothetical protein
MPHAPKAQLAAPQVLVAVRDSNLSRFAGV